MKKSEKDLYSLIVEKTFSGTSLKISEEQRKDACSLVEQELCYWSLDYNHISSY
jgi:hypothetical protein